MVFDISFSGFFEFLTRPFNSFIGWVLIIAAVFYIFLRLTGKIQSSSKRSKGKGETRPDYVMK